MLLSLLVACFSSPAPEGPSALEKERAALRSIEVERLHEAAEEALADGRLSDAAQAVVAGEDVDRAGFAGPRATLEARLPDAPPLMRAQAHAVLYEAATTPESRRAHRQAATDAQALSRYVDDEQIALSRREQAGVTRAMGHAALDALRAEFVDPLDDRALLEAAARRIAVLTDTPESPPPAGPFHEAFDALVDQGIDQGLPVETAVAELTEAAFAAADPWSSPVWPAQIAAWERHHDGVVEGVVGIQVDREGEGILVRRLIEGGSAWAAGVHQGDAVLEVRGDRGTVDARDPETTPEQVARALRGPNGTAVTVVIERDGREKAFALERGTVTSRTVKGYRREGTGWSLEVAPGVALVHITSFKPHTLADLDAVLPETPTESLVLDLRGNGGGDLAVAAQVVDRFVTEGPMLQLEGRMTGDAETDAALKAARAEGTHATPGDPWEGVSLAVLVDGDTASAAEIAAGALQQAAGAHIIGDVTVGKGVSQVLRVDEEHGIALQFTNLAWALPDGRRIHRTDDAHRWGIVPDHAVPLSPTERFVVGVLQSRREALAVHADGSPMAYAGPEIDPELPELSGDPQIEAALQVLRGE